MMTTGLGFPCEGCGSEYEVVIINPDEPIWGSADDPWPLIGSEEDPVSTYPSGGIVGMMLCRDCRHGVQAIVGDVIRERERQRGVA
jgi:hypothetical protein